MGEGQVVLFFKLEVSGTSYHRRCHMLPSPSQNCSPEKIMRDNLDSPKYQLFLGDLLGLDLPVGIKEKWYL